MNVKKETDMKKDRRSAKLTPKQIKKIIIIALAVIVIITALALYLRKRVTDSFGGRGESDVTSAEVTTGSISTSVSGSGRLSDNDVDQIDIPSEVELKKIYVNRGDKVNEGDILASVNMDSVLSAMADINDELESLDSDINSASSDSASSYISSSVSGRIKKIYAASGDNVASVMYENGALMLLSLDGYMAADISSDTLAAGDSVTVTTSDGKSYDGTVDEAAGGTATVLITDNGTALGDTVTVNSSDGGSIGEGTLYIHDELKIVGYAGTVGYVSVKENGYVYSGSTLMTLSDTTYTANYESLLSQREDLEEKLNTLIAIYKEGALYSSFSGTIREINAEDDDSRDSASSSSSTSSTTSTTSTTSSTSTASTDTDQYISYSPDSTMTMTVSVDESEILSVSIGQSAVVTIDAIDNETFAGTVTAIDKAGTSSSGVTTYTADIQIDKTDAMLSGMSASATITIDGVDNALLIPVDALNKTSTSYYVYTSYDESTGELGDMVEVTVGISNSSYAEIQSGLSEGDAVYYTEKEDSGAGFMPGGGDFGGGDFGGGSGMPSGGGDFGGGGMPSGGGPSGGFPG